MDKQTIHLITLIIAIIGSNAWSHTSLSGRITAVEARITSMETRITSMETRMDDIDKRLVIVETSLKANNQYIARILSQSKSGTPAKP